MCTTQDHIKMTTEQLLDVSDTVYIAFDLILNCFLSLLLAMLGFVGNILNICVLSQQGMRDTTNLLLLYLAVSDLIFSFLTLVYRIPNVVFYFDKHLSVSLKYCYFQVLDSIKLLSLFCSTYFITMLSVERMFAVCFPFQVSRIVTRFRIKITAMCITVILFLFLSPMYGFAYLDTAIVDNVTEIWRYGTPFYFDNYSFFSTFYLSIFINVYSMGIPIIIITSCTIMTIIKVKTSYQTIQCMSDTVRVKRVQEIRSVKISLFLSTFLILFVIVPPGIIETLLFTRYSDLRLTLKSVELLISSEQMIYVLNSSFNFIVYVITSPKFAKKVKQKLCDWK
ncbi:probable G-protein coupled receptor B0563.6 [Biomphalaria glabrata]|uniref:Probable G-protein coupled receptor B0563.6 n=1 Tax=Biomphalaria glabrata TaxID=6526 RepID=A0A9W2YD56_BIOGL|nr:probable G-protein coupled receptor B0563.6 [Biomphalaria glabrata]